MIKEEKVKLVNELQDKFKKAKAAFVTDYKGLKVGQVTTLRKSLRDASVEFKVVKNTLAKIAIKEAGAESLKDYFDGTTAVAMSYADPVAAAKILTQFAKDEPNLKIRVGLLGGKLLNLNEIKALSELPSREVLLGKLVGMLRAVPTNLVGVLSGVPRQLVYTLVAIQAKKQ
ncbi:MAG: 50S ribosomal protein L10 [Deltaproteobacteria bacterium GWC2_42_51]|nr:MAG: 50S ribosomal protein L10 [Deltaproteobacteria bacterium GWB2_42_7]OGP32090.1 MAG: 50S ribosomal protein L10 [Deltaproteobacteria bacterium GWC2_42_51]OGP47931.1 MAG: 50S ribosomal protein L10 [Deltaproteobacteria bacterium GWF2_42_12]OGQ24556.1 MAG: 50S ribosomal protein L10 [Deltaproteobacteria bacterium RIFCSPHIGHO2_02_FULL_42_44]OGQ36578.1 MAG: 50S ribosomal protein L10 [Deltaproteobacteria bacterium RIFCSPLOWO2_02_FULL_42_39]OGQ66327.1 MAG: 50S ribosomal protein L10 [Deltaproteoba